MLIKSKKQRLLLMILVGLSGCQFRKIKSPQDLTSTSNAASQTEGSTEVRSQVYYESIRKNILEPYCLKCHQGRRNPNLSTYENVIAHLNEIKITVINKKSMPPRKPLKEDLSQLLSDWIAQGALFEAGPNDTPTPTPTIEPSSEPTPLPSDGPSVTPVRVNFTLIKEQVLLKNCLSCHRVGNEDGNTELETYESIMSVKQWIEPLVFGKGKTPGGQDIIIPETDRMPPLDTRQLSADQLKLLRQWIDEGFKE